jgi:hypothetical protein
MDQGFSWLIDGFVTQFFNLIFNKFLFSFFPNPQNQVGFSRTRGKKGRKEKTCSCLALYASAAWLQP